MSLVPDDRPRSAASIRISDDDRERTISRLSDAYARGVIAVDEMERRMESVYSAAISSDLAALVDDLPTANAGSAHNGTIATNAPPRLSALFSSIESMDIEILPPRLDLHATFGSIELDLRGTVFQHATTEIHIDAKFGSVEIYLPAHVVIENSGSGIFGSFSILDATRGERTDALVRRPGAPVLRITGRAIFGSVEITRVPT
jgi:Domain of unknown function (DUF1707)/Cell wall-active antibiotics response 4TMS YvqF